MNKKLSLIAITALLVTTATHTEFSVENGFEKTCASGATLLFGGLGLYFITKGLTIAEEGGVSFKELIEGKFGGNFLRQWIGNYLDPESPKEARKNVLFGLASFGLLTGLCIAKSFSNT